MPDYATYEGLYGNAIRDDFNYFIEFTFIGISKAANFLSSENPIMMFLIYAFIGVSVKFYAINKISSFAFFLLSFM